jgi:hypothetical protein
MIPVFLGALAGVCVASWVGMLLMEWEAWSGVPMLVAGLGAFLGTLWWTRAQFPRGHWAIPLMALAASLTLLPGIDTTLMSQDASLYNASGRHLAREGTIRVTDPRLAGMDAVERAALFSLGSFSTGRVSFSRLPGGLVVPDDRATAAIPSFSHLLIVWIAFADWSGGSPAILLLGPLLAFLALWAIGLLAEDQAGWLGAAAALTLLASWMPENFFARFLMPEILTQALVWGGVFVARLANREREEPGGWLLAVLCGLSLGVSAMARLEQIFIFIPALFLCRAILPMRIRILPPLAWALFGLGVAQALFDLMVLPTDYTNRILKVLVLAYSVPVRAVLFLVNNDGHIATPLLRYGLPAMYLLALVGLGFVLRRLEKKSAGLGVRSLSALIGGSWLLLVLLTPGQNELPVLSAVSWYLPKILWIPFLMGAPGFLSLGGLEVVLLLQSLDQVIAGRVSVEQIWAARRLVGVVLPLLALMAASALACRNRRARRLAGVAIVLGILLALPMLSPLVARPLQRGGPSLVREIADAVPADALLVLARPLDWTHLAAAIWVGEGGPVTLVVREKEVKEHQAALRKLLRREAQVYYLTGTFASDAPAPLSPEEEGLLRGWDRIAVQTWNPVFTRLQPEVDGPPTKVQEIRGRLELFRLKPSSHP